MNEEKIQILVVDDNVDITTLIAIHLSEEGFGLSVRNDGDSAVDLLESMKIDLLLLDVTMPGKSGFDVLEEIKKLKNTENIDIPVIMVTAKSELADIDRALELGATAYIVKPFRVELLLSKIHEVLMETGKLGVAQSDETILSKFGVAAAEMENS